MRVTYLVAATGIRKNMSESVRKKLVQEEEESQKSGTAHINASRQNEGRHRHPDREAAAGRRGGKSSSGMREKVKIRVRDGKKRARQKMRRKKETNFNEEGREEELWLSSSPTLNVGSVHPVFNKNFCQSMTVNYLYAGRMRWSKFCVPQMPNWIEFIASVSMSQISCSVKTENC